MKIASAPMFFTNADSTATPSAPPPIATPAATAGSAQPGAPPAPGMRVHIALTTGGRYQFGEIQIEQSAISDRLFAGYLRFAEGQPYSP